MECLLFSSNNCRLVADKRSFHYFDVTSLKLWHQIKGYCYTKPYFRTYVYNFRTKSIQINNLNIYLLKNVKNWKCENLPIRALFLRCASFGVSQLKRRLQRFVWVYTCQNATLLEITCHGSYYLTEQSLGVHSTLLSLEGITVSWCKHIRCCWNTT